MQLAYYMGQILVNLKNQDEKIKSKTLCITKYDNKTTN